MANREPVIPSCKEQAWIMGEVIRGLLPAHEALIAAARAVVESQSRPFLNSAHTKFRCEVDAAAVDALRAAVEAADQQ